MLPRLPPPGPVKRAGSRGAGAPAGAKLLPGSWVASDASEPEWSDMKLVDPVVPSGPSSRRPPRHFDAKPPTMLGGGRVCVLLRGLRTDLHEEQWLQEMEQDRKQSLAMFRRRRWKEGAAEARDKARAFCEEQERQYQLTMIQGESPRPNPGRMPLAFGYGGRQPRPAGRALSEEPPSLSARGGGGGGGGDAGYPSAAGDGLGAAASAPPVALERGSLQPAPASAETNLGGGGGIGSAMRLSAKGGGISSISPVGGNLATLGENSACLGDQREPASASSAGPPGGSCGGLGAGGAVGSSATAGGGQTMTAASPTSPREVHGHHPRASVRIGAVDASSNAGPASGRRRSVQNAPGGSSNATARHRHSVMPVRASVNGRRPSFTEPQPKKGIKALPHKRPLSTRLKSLNSLRKQTAEERAAEVVVRHLSPEERERLEKVFAIYDEDGSGTLDTKELKDALSDLGYCPKSREEKVEFSRILIEADSDGNGELEIEEFEQLVIMVMDMLRNVQRNELYELFLLHDFDGTGALNMQEVFVILGRLQLAPRTSDEKKIIQELITANDKDGSQEVDFKEFNALLIEVRERLTRWRRARSRAIAETLSPIIAEKFKGELCEFRDQFEYFDEDGNGRLDEQEIDRLVAEYGLGPSNKTERAEIKEIIANADQNKDKELGFVEFLNLVQALRLRVKNKSMADLQELFAKVDKDGSGSLSFAECSRLLEMMGLVPKTRAEQRQIGELLEEADEDGSGELEFSEFVLLYQRVTERLKAMAWKEQMEAAKELEISIENFMEYKSAFEMLDATESGELDQTAIRRMMDVLRIPISGDALNELFQEVDDDESGLVTFCEFLKLLSLVESHVGKHGSKVVIPANTPSSP
eukprot:TRINITY_DN6386_c0_g1_i2.p1 TRINITY_DN6386_c0_g1~~TRINITY_DN6386_c0_g1_i2.p1  ORF type:complete len:873 (-),score=232.31 TRINITY_DN6386_c0_g1_i2:139-2757(-)